MSISLQFLFISLISGVLHLDTTVFGQVMLSRPIVTGPIIGYLLNIPEIGLQVGIIMELIYISIIPVGVKVPPDATAATILSIMCTKVMDCVPVSIFFGTIFGLLYKYTDISFRSLNSVLIHWVDTAKPELMEKRIFILSYLGIVFCYFKTVLFYLLLLPIMSFVIEKICVLIKTCGMQINLQNMVYVLPAIGVGIAIAHFTER